MLISSDKRFDSLALHSERASWLKLILNVLS